MHGRASLRTCCCVSCTSGGLPARGRATLLEARMPSCCSCCAAGCMRGAGGCWAAAVGASLSPTTPTSPASPAVMMSRACPPAAAACQHKNPTTAELPVLPYHLTQVLLHGPLMGAALHAGPGSQEASRPTGGLPLHTLSAAQCCIRLRQQRGRSRACSGTSIRRWPHGRPAADGAAVAGHVLGLQRCLSRRHVCSGCAR